MCPVSVFLLAVPFLLDMSSLIFMAQVIWWSLQENLPNIQAISSCSHLVSCYDKEFIALSHYLNGYHVSFTCSLSASYTRILARREHRFLFLVTKDYPLCRVTGSTEGGFFSSYSLSYVFHILRIFFLPCGCLNGKSGPTLCYTFPCLSPKWGASQLCSTPSKNRLVLLCGLPNYQLGSLCLGLGEKEINTLIHFSFLFITCIL